VGVGFSSAAKAVSGKADARSSTASITASRFLENLFILITPFCLKEKTFAYTYYNR
jgi:hypothetical protein